LLTPAGDDFWFGSRYSSGGNSMGGYNASSGDAIGSVSGANSMIADGTNIYYITDTAIVKLQRSDSQTVWSRSCSNPRAVIKSGSTLYAGGSNSVFAIDSSTGNQSWSATVDGVIYGLAVADGRLFASADNGKIYVFSADGPSVSNDSGAEVLSSTSALLHGYLVSTGGAPATVSVFWGQECGDDIPETWMHTNFLGQCGEGPLSVPVGGLIADKSYCYRFYATNKYGAAWASEVSTFITGQVEIHAVDAVAGEEAPNPGGFVVMRPAATTNVSLTVLLNISGSATAGADYDEIASSITIPVGAVQQSITLIPVDDMVLNEPSETVEIAVAPGPYLPSVSKAVIEILDNDSLDKRAYTDRMKISTSGYSRQIPLKDFPVLVRLDETIPGFKYSRFRGINGGDLRFTDGAISTGLDFEIDEWNTNGVSTVWVRLPSLNDSNTFFRAFWGNTAATNLPSCATNGETWGCGFSAVWHLQEDAGLRIDAVGNGLDGNPMYGVSSASGVAGQAAVFDGSNDYIAVPSLPAGNITTFHGWTMEAWIRADNMTANQYPTILSFGRWGASLGLDPASMKEESWINTWDEAESSGTVSTSVWTQVVMVYSDRQRHFYINGQPVGMTSAPEVQTGAGTDLRIGAADVQNGEYTKFNGCIDEVRLSSCPRSSNWVWAAWMNVSSNQALLNYGPIVSDIDGDGIGDGWEMAIFSNLVRATEFSDSDHDGFSDYSEYRAGTDPNDAESFLAITAVRPQKTTGKLRIVWRSEPGQFYRVESTSNLNISSWNMITHEIQSMPPTNVLDITAENRGFYRVKLSSDPM